MREKIVYQTDNDGFYVGPAVAYESPLDPGVFLIPSGCTELAPPEAPDGYRARLDDGQWSVHAIVVQPYQEPEQPAPAVDDSPEQSYERAIQLHMDNAAITFGYNDIMSAVTYAEEPAVESFQREGRAFRAWRSVVWAYTYAQQARIQRGERAQPTIEEFILELPELVVPDAPQ